MSGVIKSIGKAFKKVVKVVKVVAPIALAVGAVVMTGGAALGLTPTFAAGIGSVVGGLGLSTTLTGALTGAVVSAGFGSAVGGATAAATGNNVLKGMQKGAAVGAVTGGVAGAVAPSAFGISGATSATTPTGTTGLLNAGRQAISAPTLGAAPLALDAVPAISATGALGGAASAGLASAAGIAAPALASAPLAVNAVPAISAAASGGGGLLGFASQNPMLAGSLISGAAKGLGGTSGDGRTYADQQDSQEDSSKFAYGGAYAGKADPFGLKPYATPSIAPAYTPPAGPRWQYDSKTNSIVEVGA